jgi:hypothetical protein
MLRLHKNERAGIHVTELEQRKAAVVVREGRRGKPLAERVIEATTVEAVAAEREQAGWVRALVPEPHAARFYREGFEDMLVRDYNVARGATL